MLQAIQDEVIKRALNFFGLRGPVTHDYESTVLPVVVIGDLGQPTLSLQSGSLITSPWPLVPNSKVWRPIMASGRITQSGGTIAPVLHCSIQGLGLPGFWIPFYLAQALTAGTSGVQIRQAATLNSVFDFTVVFPPDLFIPAGGSVVFGLAAGDGTLSLSSGSVLLVHELGEGLVSLQ